MGATGDYTIEAAARALGVTPRAVRKWARAGLLPATRLPGGRARIPAAAVAGLYGDRSMPAGRLNQVDDHFCFGCGRLNPAGLQLSFVADGAEVRAAFTPGRLSEGWAGATHGGILATLLDEVLAWTLFHHQIWAVTTRLAITYRRPAPIGAPLTASGRIVQDRGRLVEVAGEAREAGGAVVAEATATFVRVSAEQRARLERIYGVGASTRADEERRDGPTA
jgi:excisionase family DNA binding protein/uncharacterized protein (TIGR00369 family)